MGQLGRTGQEGAVLYPGEPTLKRLEAAGVGGPTRLSPCASEDRSSGPRFRSPARGGRVSCVAPRSVRRVIRARAEAAGAGLENPSLGRVSDHSLSACDPSESAFRLGTTLSTIGHGVQPLEPLFSMLGSRCSRSEHSLRSLNQASLPILDLVRMQSRLLGKLG